MFKSFQGLKREFSDFELNYSHYLPKNKDAKILDIGCGNGQFLSYLKWKGFTDISGVDINAESIDFCKKNITAQVFHIKELDQFLKDKKEIFDLIILMEVVYYFPDDKISSYFASIHRALKYNGQIIVQVFNGCCLTGTYYKVRDQQIKRVYCDESIKGCIESMGFMVKHIEERRYPIDSFFRLLWVCSQRLWYMALRIIYIIERGTSGNPSIFSRLIFCVAKKK